MQNTQRKKLIIIGVIAIIILLIPLIIFLINSQYSATLNTTIAPSFATLTIDGKTYPINEELHFKPTTTTAIISAEGFQTQEIDIDLIKNDTTTLALYLIPDDGDLSWYQDHTEEQYLFQIVGGVQASNSADEFLEEHPISEILPYQYADIIDDNPINYRIDIGKFDGCNSDFCIKITDYTTYSKGYALDFIKQNGYNPDDYQIFYEETIDPNFFK